MTTIPAHDSGNHADDGSGHGSGHHDHASMPWLKHHFDTPAQQFESSKLGMWLFLATEVLFFGGLFVWYAVLRSLHPEVFTYAAGYLDTVLGGINTCVLILSSLTMALAVRFAQTDNRRGLIICLVLTFAGAVGFLVIKKIEYEHKWHEHLLWGSRFYEVPPGHHGDEHAAHGAAVADAAHASAAPTPPAVDAAVPAAPLGAAAAVAAATGDSATPPVEATVIKRAPGGPSGVVAGVTDEGAPVESHSHGPVMRTGAHLEDPALPPNTHLFFGVYFAMTGLHAIHVIVGMIVIGWLIVGSIRGQFSSQYYTPVDLVGLYWHIVDLIWIFLFPLFYIIH